MNNHANFELESKVLIIVEDTPVLISSIMCSLEVY